MQSYTWYIPTDEIDEYSKMRFRLIDLQIPLYFLPRTELVDSINVSDPFTQNTKIGYTTINYTDLGINHVFYIDDTSDMGNLAIELVDEIIKHKLSKEQLYIVTTFYAREMNALLSLKMGILGPVQEDYFSAYFTGHTIRNYGYKKSGYWKNNYDNNELDEGEDFTYSKFSLRGKIREFIDKFKNHGSLQ